MFQVDGSTIDPRPSGPGSSADTAAAFARGRAAYPQLAVDHEAFARHLARAAGWIPDAATLATLVVEDLFLACACLTNVAGAADTIIALHGDVIRHTIERTIGDSNSDEIAQGVISDMIVGSPTSAPEIGNYAGRAPLARWLEVVARRAAFRWLRAERKTAGVAALAAAEPFLGATAPEIALFRERYGLDFQRALQSALGRAPESDRAILRLYLVSGVTVEKIGKMLGVSQSTASRWLARAREDLLSDLTAILKERLGISSDEIESLARLLASRLDLSITEALADDQTRAGRA
ncbi:MAG TPA: sigma-70 family RNA polymerase sigma factor [Polyangia bacterium]|nr:sigma-70 family RNA polymerase sigma factor [Polyangia bacterium]